MHGFAPQRYFRKTLRDQGTATIKWKPPLNVRHSVFRCCFLPVARPQTLKGKFHFMIRGASPANIEGLFIRKSNHCLSRPEMGSLPFSFNSKMWDPSKTKKNRALQPYFSLLAHTGRCTLGKPNSVFLFVQKKLSISSHFQFQEKYFPVCIDDPWITYG